MKRRMGAVILAPSLASLALLGGAVGESVARTPANNSNSPITAGAKHPSTRHACNNYTQLVPTHADIALVISATTCLVNRERAHAGLHELQSNSYLQRLASEQTEEMVAGDYFGDDSIAGMTPMQRIAVSHYASHGHSLWAGQNIGWATLGQATPQAMVQAWMQSPPHRQIMLNPNYRDIGTGISPSAPPRLAEGMPGATYAIELGAHN